MGHMCSLIIYTYTLTLLSFKPGAFHSSVTKCCKAPFKLSFYISVFFYQHAFFTASHGTSNVFVLCYLKLQPVNMFLWGNNSGGSVELHADLQS